jgi:hypothetical protein
MIMMLYMNRMDFSGSRATVGGPEFRAPDTIHLSGAQGT